jgi:hypothetical protein
MSSGEPGAATAKDASRDARRLDLSLRHPSRRDR